MEVVLSTLRHYFIEGALEKNTTDGGPKCYGYLPSHIHLIETAYMLPILLLFWERMASAGRKYNRKLKMKHIIDFLRPFPRRKVDWLLGIVLVIVFGAEIGYKIASRKIMYLLQPCHVVSTFQIWLLFSPERKFTHRFVAYMMGWIFGPLMAILSPDTSCLLLPGEVAIYWIQHILIVVVVPFYLLCARGPDDVARVAIFDRNWLLWVESVLTCQVYHWFMLHPLAHLTWVNLNYMLCPPPGIGELVSAFAPREFYRTFLSAVMLFLAPIVMYIYIVIARKLARHHGIVVPEKLPGKPSSRSSSRTTSRASSRTASATTSPETSDTEDTHSTRGKASSAAASSSSSSSSSARARGNIIMTTGKTVPLVSPSSASSHPQDDAGEEDSEHGSLFVKKD
eukprot:TRINITY_DN4772_c0_g1::TRINITY_DN4772_c0_g1_i1::g.21415::m.21415 TRINITY_DN4772_c0_g1::TRINITY_DN4772_c0_g1_i1::g.21415  ORF type:complete len:410 (-),score=77.45,sp/Q5U3C3/TM164_HUMAN/32.46/4e-20,TMEM164/PF14808.1/2.3e-43,DUF2217/PF10265.4/2.1,Herpes_capsid/PF06112.6/4.5 TRINITY_DN4772_c0_g1_i1:578-1765(-)